MWGRCSLMLGSLLALLWPALCAAESAGEACARLKQSIAPASIGLPSGGATIETAELVPPAPLAAAELPFGPLPPDLAVVPAAPEYCKMTGAIAPVDPKAPPIRFQVNLPTAWNGSSVQFGGGGFNGVLITGLGLPPLARADRPSPLAQGFVTYGTDSGHQNAPGVPLQAFALNDEALSNFAYASYKKVRDVAVELMKRRYGAAPAKLYFVGSSEGGREGLTMAQRYPADFDGILSGVPVINWVGLQAAGTRDRRGAVRRRLARSRQGQAGAGRGARRLRRARRPRRRHRQRLRRLQRRLRSGKLACRTRAIRHCLTPAQLEAVKLVHSPAGSLSSRSRTACTAIPAGVLAAKRRRAPVRSAAG